MWRMENEEIGNFGANCAMGVLGRGDQEHRAASCLWTEHPIAPASPAPARLAGSSAFPLPAPLPCSQQRRCCWRGGIPRCGWMWRSASFPEKMTDGKSQDGSPGKGWCMAMKLLQSGISPIAHSSTCVTTDVGTYGQHHTCAAVHHPPVPWSSLYPAHQ